MKSLPDIESYKNTLRNILLHFAEIPQHQLDEFVSLFSIESYPKRTIIIGPNAANGKFYFLVKGLVRIYYMGDEKEIISDFKENNSFFLNGYTLFTGLPNIDFHEALKDSICLAADYSEIERLSKKYHAIEHLGRKMVERHYASYLITNYNKLFLSAEERYDVFKRERASVMNMVSLRHIASHLGITPETLSRLRAKHTSVKA